MCVGNNYVEHAQEFNSSGFDASARFLAPGDRMEVTIDGIGTLANPCA
jgi:2-keto-4-pentenoate hydratase/2-oxohepta-3-ene-1,7-dioic acid hydratase in catechol pathway